MQKSDIALRKVGVEIKTRTNSETSGSNWAPWGQESVASA